MNTLKNLYTISGKEDAYRGPAIRALCAITDPAMLQAIERYMKQAIVDRSPAIASAALVSSLHIAKTGAGTYIFQWIFSNNYIKFLRKNIFRKL